MCVPTWVVLTCGCEQEQVANGGRTGAALIGMFCEIPRSACPSRPGGGGVPLGCVRVTGKLTSPPLELLKTVKRTHVLGGEGRTRRKGFGEDASFEKLGKGVTGALCITEVFTQLKCGRAPKGVFRKTQLQELLDRELRGSISCGGVVCGRRGSGFKR